MGKTHSRRGASAAPAAKPSRKRRRGKHARADFPRNARLGLPSAQAELPKNWIPAKASERSPFGELCAGMNGESLDAGASRSAADHTPAAAPAPRVVGPSLRQDIPRPPLRTLALGTLRHGKLTWQRGRDRLRRTAARTAAYVVACLDAFIWQPVMWPFRPAQREMLARTLAVLSLALVAAGWIAVYSALAPTQDARATAAPPAPSKPFAARVVSRALPRVTLPKAKAPALRPPQLRPPHW